MGVADDDGRWEGNVQKRRYASWWMFLCVLFYFAVVLSFFRSFFIILVSLSKVGYGCVCFLLCYVRVCECVSVCVSVFVDGLGPVVFSYEYYFLLILQSS